MHTAQQDAVPLILVVGQVPKGDLRRQAFQEIDYRQMFGTIAKWVVEVTDPDQLAQAGFDAVRIATSGTPGPVVRVVPEDVQQQPTAQPAWTVPQPARLLPSPTDIERVRALLEAARRPLLIAGGALESSAGGRAALLDLAETNHVPVAVSFRRNDLFPHRHPLFVGELGLANPNDQNAAFEASDLIIALGTRLGDITTQGYTFPKLPQPSQPLVHIYPDPDPTGLHFAVDIGVACDPAAFARELGRASAAGMTADRVAWASGLRAIHERIAPRGRLRSPMTGSRSCA